MQEAYPIFVIFGILILRLNMSSLMNFGYHLNQHLFPVEYRSLASGTMNFIGRSIGAFSFILVEYTTQPVMFVLVISLFVFFTINGLITEPDLNLSTNESMLTDNYNRSSERSH